MEKQLFDWVGWDTLDLMYFQFYECTLVRDIGEHKVGDKFDLAALNYGDGQLILQRGDKEWKYELAFAI